MTDPYKGLRLPPFEALEETLLRQIVTGLYTSGNAMDVLSAREAFWFALDQIDSQYCGFVGCTVEGVLVFADTLTGIGEALDEANPPGRIGYYTWIEAEPST